MMWRIVARPRRGRERVPAEGGAVVAGHEVRARALRAPGSRRWAHRRRGPSRGVMMSGSTPSCSYAKRRAGAADAGLDLVEDEQQALFVAPVADALQVARGGHVDAALALDGLEQDGDGLVGGGRLDGVEVVPRGRGEARGAAARRARGSARCRWRRARRWCGRGSRRCVEMIS